MSYFGTDIKELQELKTKWQYELSELIKNNADKEEMEAAKSELKHIDLQIKRIIGTNEIKRIDQIKNKKKGNDDINKKKFEQLKKMYKKIAPITTAVNNILYVATSYERNNILVTKPDEKVKARVA